MEIVTTFGSKMVAISTRNTKIEKTCELRKAITDLTLIDVDIFHTLQHFFNQVLQFYYTFTRFFHEISSLLPGFAKIKN